MEHRSDCQHCLFPWSIPMVTVLPIWESCWQVLLIALFHREISQQRYIHYSDVIMSAMASEPQDCLLNRLFRHRWKKTSKLRVTGLCEGNSPVTGEFPTQMASNSEHVSIWWRHHVILIFMLKVHIKWIHKLFSVIHYQLILPIYFMITALAMRQSCDCPSDSETTLKDVDEYIRGIS